MFNHFPVLGGSAMGTWQLDPYHTQIEFATKHLGFMTVRGHFLEVALTSDIDPDHPEMSSAQVTIQTASVHTGTEARDNDLRTSNFLEVDKYPVITFKSTSAGQAGPDQYTMTGDLTIKETTRPVTIEVTKLGEVNDPEMMGHRIGYTARTQIRRHDFGLAFDFIRDGKMVIGEEIQITIEGEIVEQKEPAADSS
jgi:polyisoprenoid-binding protein YceI